MWPISGGSSRLSCWGERKPNVAQTKSKSQSKPKSKSKSSGSRAKSAKSKATPKATQKSATQKSSSTSSNGVSDSIKEGARHGADSIKHGAGEVAPLMRKAKVPLLASGAALVGVAGAIAATRSARNRHKVMGISMPKANGVKPDAKKIGEAVVDAAKRADRFGQGVSRVASTVRDTAETANAVAKKV